MLGRLARSSRKRLIDHGAAALLFSEGAAAQAAHSPSRVGPALSQLADRQQSAGQAGTSSTTGCTPVVGPASAWRSFAAVPQPFDPAQHGYAPAMIEHHQDSNVQIAEHPLPAKAFYLGSHLNVITLAKEAEQLKYPFTNAKGAVVICVTPHRKRSLRENECSTGLPMETYVAAYKYGSVVIFNADKDREEKILRLCKGHVSDPPRHRSYTDEYRIVIAPQLATHSHLTADRVMLQQLHWNNLKTLSIVLAQSVALDHYNEQAEKALSGFLELNSTLARSGDFRDVEKEHLLKMVAKTTIILTDIIVKLGLQERFDIAWKSSEHNDVYTHLRDEFEIGERFDQVRTKLELVQDNLKYCLEIMQNKKSVLLEWVIIVLIAVEIALGVYDNGLAVLFLQAIRSLSTGL